MIWKIKHKEFKKAEKELLIINSLKTKYENMNNDELKSQTEILKKRLLEKSNNIENIRHHAFAVAREATKRVLKKWMFDVQIIGGLILDYGSVAEMKTGEGKTITSICPIYLNALSGKGVIISTVNEYLANRDAEENGLVFDFLGLSTGVNLRKLSNEEKKQEYQKDVLYSVHSELGFDYLRDNMVQKFDEKVQRNLNFALIDEVDSILIDEAKTPLIITGGGDDLSKIYIATDIFVKTLKSNDYKIDWEFKTIQLLDSGIQKANNFFKTQSIYNIENSEIVHRIQNSLRANHLMQNEHDYLVKDNEILLIDAFTGRIMEGRAYSDGLQQAIQAKEKVEIKSETQTLATITYQNFFRMFAKLSGMTGTAKTEEEEFLEIYNMNVIEIPTNRPLIRKDQDDIIFNNKTSKFKEIVKKIEKINKKGQPILVGTESVHDSEILSSKLKIANIRHTVLNAKQDENEAKIIGDAGQFKAVTIATNMAGRGTDIKLDDKSKKVGGLFVLGTSKAEARRIDNQLRGRSGRQGDPGESIFMISLEDSLLKRFSRHEKIVNQFKDFGDEPIKAKMVSRSLKKAQKIIEGHNFDSRKNVLQFDDIIRQQRNLIYAQRDIIISQEDLYEVISRMLYSVVEDLLKFDQFLTNDGILNIKALSKSLNVVWLKNLDFKFDVNNFKNKSNEEIAKIIKKDMKECYELIREKTISKIGEEGFHELERQIVLKTFDDNWKLHLDKMTKLRSSSSLASYAQKNPFQVYIEKGNIYFKDLLSRISHNAIKIIMNIDYARDTEDPENEKVLKEIIKKIKDNRKNKENDNETNEKKLVIG